MQARAGPTLDIPFPCTFPVPFKRPAPRAFLFHSIPFRSRCLPPAATSRHAPYHRPSTSTQFATHTSAPLPIRRIERHQ